MFSVLAYYNTGLNTFHCQQHELGRIDAQNIMFRVFCIFGVLPGCSHAAPQWDNTSKLAPLVARVEVSLDAHRALITKLQSDRKTLAELVGATGDLEPIYMTVVNDYRGSIESAVAVSSAVAALDQVAIALFEEWRSEIRYLTDDRIKTSNEAQFAAQWQRYEGLIPASATVRSDDRPGVG